MGQIENSRKKQPRYLGLMKKMQSRHQFRNYYWRGNLRGKTVLAFI